jgi:hypothetical protein
MREVMHRNIVELKWFFHTPGQKVSGMSSVQAHVLSADPHPALTLIHMPGACSTFNPASHLCL